MNKQINENKWIDGIEGIFAVWMNDLGEWVSESEWVSE